MLDIKEIKQIKSQREGQKAQLESEDDKSSLLMLFRFADTADIIMMILGSLGSLCVGACTPLTFYIAVGFDKSYYLADNNDKIQDGQKNMMEIIYIGIAAFALGWMMTVMWVITGERQFLKCKRAYYASLLNKDAEFFDCNQHSLLNSKFTLDTGYIQSAIGQKIGVVLLVAGNFICATIISFWHGWFMALVMLATIVILLFVAAFNMNCIKNKEKIFLQLYSRAGGRAEEAMTAIKTVKQFNAASYELQTYSRLLQGSSKDKLGQILKISLSLGMVNSIVFLIYSFGFWFGGKCMAGDNLCLTNLTGGPYTGENVHIIFFTQLVCLLQFSALAPATKQIILGKEAAQRIFKVIYQSPRITMNQGGIRLEKFEGRVQFRNVTFAYPKDKSKKILDRLSLCFDLRSSALVGQSGCGKSTIVQLLMRFYDADEGEVLINGHDVRELDLGWLRSCIGYVGQQPVLFAATIRENLLYSNPDASEEQMAEALRQAEVHEFVFGQLEKGLETQVGVGGSQISGGQKQRIAIARALVKQPQLLILDEATSALDRSNERAIQQTLNKIAETLTTITIAHRISTIQESNTVFVIKEGKVQEQGKFEDLLYFKTSDFNNQEENLIQQVKIMPNEKTVNNSSQIILKSQQIQTTLTSFAHLEGVQKAVTINNSLQRYQNIVFLRILSFNKSKKLIFALSVLISMGLGLIFPIFSIFLSEVYFQVIEFQYNPSLNSSNNIDISSFRFLLTALVTFFLYFFQSFCGQIVGNEISTNLRTQAYGKILNMPITWFETAKNNCGTNSSILSVECEKVKELITTYIYLITRCVTMIISGLIIMFYYQWMMSLVIIGFVFAFILSGFVKSHFKTKLTKQADRVSKKTMGIIQESLINIRTVSAFNMQKVLIDKYEKELSNPSESLMQIGMISGMMNGIVLFIMTSVAGVFLYLGLIMMINYGAGKINILTSISQFNFMAITLAKNFSFLPDVESLKISAANIFSLLDGEDQEEMQEREGSKRLTEGFKGDIEFRDVSFKYEDRQQNVLSDLNLTIREGEKAALVGASGCGKSTFVQLLLRFYEPTAGSIWVGGIALRDFDLAFLRSQFGVVAQEPVVFNCSYRDNIRYNTPATEQQIRNAAKQANAMAFIEQAEAQAEEVDKEGKKESKKEKEGKVQQVQKGTRVQKEGQNGLGGQVGVRGFHISGGQKQRVAIARVLLRSPKMLLLDQATSALDADNEREVQRALDSAMADRTTVTVAHRIETIKNSHTIHVLAKARLAESGTYEELIERKGTFWNIANGNKV